MANDWIEKRAQRDKNDVLIYVITKNVGQGGDQKIYKRGLW